MKISVKLFALGTILLGFSLQANAQATATATATATVIAPIAIAKTVDMNFGNLAVIAAGTVIMDPTGSRTASGGVTLPGVTGSVAAASFSVTGSGDSTYSITLPSTATTVTDVASNTMTVDTWVSIPSITGTLAGGTQTLNVGATLHVGAGQAAGVYVSGIPFTVTVNYN